MSKLIVYLKGMFMGAADIIPGVSGGSIALITGIYDQLIEAIGSIGFDLVKDFFRGDFKKVAKDVNFGFLIPLLAGILTSIFTMARLMNFLLEEYTLYTWSTFFGLILASSYVIGKQFKLTTLRLLNLVAGGLISFVIVGLVPVNTPNALWFMFLSGAIAICAMILPGISGAFLLLILGKYHYITEIIKDPFHLDHIIVLLVVALGCLVGILSFSKVLNYVLDNWHAGTMAFLTGMMLGSLRKIWPYKEVVESKIVDGDVFVVAEQLVRPWEMEGFAFSILFMVIGFLVIIILDLLTSTKEK